MACPTCIPKQDLLQSLVAVAEKLTPAWRNFSLMSMIVRNTGEVLAPFHTPTVNDLYSCKGTWKEEL